MKKTVCFLLFAVQLIFLTPSAFAEAGAPSPWAAEDVQEAITLGMVPERLQNNWQQDLSRSEFAELAIYFLAVQYGYGAGTGFSVETFIEDYLNFRSPNGKPLSKADYLSEQEASSSYSYSWPFILNEYNFFDDMEPYISTYVNMAHLLGIAKGQDENHYNPMGAITRQEAATLLARTYEIYGVLEPQNHTTPIFTDTSLIAPWAQESVTAMSSWDILQGNEGGAFLPNGRYTREQGVTAFMRLYRNMPITRNNDGISPLLTCSDVVARCRQSGPNPIIQYEAETDICTVLYIVYSNAMYMPDPTVFLIYGNSTYRRIDGLPWMPTDFQLTEQDTKLTFSTVYTPAEHYTLDLKTGALEKTVYE